MPGLRTLSLLALVWFSSLSSAQEQPLRQTIDTEIKKAWQAEKITPAGRSSDAVFLRRIYLDFVGVVPTYVETTAFLKDADPKKREKLIDKLLADPRFGPQQAHVWDLILFGRTPQNIFDTRKHDSFTKWMAGQFAKNVPYDRLIQKILAADEDGSEMFYVQYKNSPEEAATAVSRVFLGTQLQLPAATTIPSNIGRKKISSAWPASSCVWSWSIRGKNFKIAEKGTGDVLFAGSVKELKPGMKGDPVKPKFLGGAELKEPAAPKGVKEPEFKGKGMPPKPAFSQGKAGGMDHGEGQPLFRQGRRQPHLGRN